MFFNELSELIFKFLYSLAKSWLCKAVWWVLEGIILGIISVLGIIGNATAINVFYKRSSGVLYQFILYAGQVFHRLMLSLAVCDLLYVVTSLAIFSAPQLCPQYTGNIKQFEKKQPLNCL